MAGFSAQELREISAHLEKVCEIHATNINSDEIELDIPDVIDLKRTANDEPLGSIEWSVEYDEYIFIPHSEKTIPARYSSSIPLPPPLHTYNP